MEPAQSDKRGGNTPADLVNPYIGSISHLLTTTVPEVFVPYSYIRAFPLGEGGVERGGVNRVSALYPEFIMPGIPSLKACKRWRTRCTPGREGPSRSGRQSFRSCL